LLKRESIKLDGVLNYDLPMEQIVTRLSRPRTCAVARPCSRDDSSPRVQGVCDHCGGKLVQREDDRPEAVRLRMEVYEKSTKPLADYYRQRGCF